MGRYVKILIFGFIGVLTSGCNEPKRFHSLESLPDDKSFLQGTWLSDKQLSDGKQSFADARITILNDMILLDNFPSGRDFDGKKDEVPEPINGRFKFRIVEYASGCALIGEFYDPIYISRSKDQWHLEAMPHVNGPIVRFTKTNE